MNSDFPRIITLLRKERGLSQKQAALELGVSQALLSHYEKGIRECGLDFVIHIADYYDVSCDYLLGRTPDRQGATLTIEDLPDSRVVDEDPSKESTLVTLNKKLIQNSINVLYELLDEADNKDMTTEVSSYLMVSVYKMLRTLYSSNPKNPEAMFSVSPDVYDGLSSALQCILATNASQLAEGQTSDGFKGLEPGETPALTPEVISKLYPDLAPSLYNLIQKTEERIKKLG